MAIVWIVKMYCRVCEKETKHHVEKLSNRLERWTCSECMTSRQE